MISQFPVNEWYGTIGDNTLADAILDRIVHNSHRLELGGESMRKIESEKTEKQVLKKEKTAGGGVIGEKKRTFYSFFDRKEQGV